MGGQKHKKPGKSGGNKHKNKDKSSAASTTKPVTMSDISVEFQTIILDFIRDIHGTFPEYHEVLTPYLGYSHEMKPMPDELYIELYTHCRMVYPVRFFDILYKNDALFAMEADKSHATQNADAGTEFLPGVDFREIWATEDITENTKDIIWKYLQLVLFSIVNNLSDMGSFGDTAKLFEAIDNNELKMKLEEVIGEMGTMFGMDGSASEQGQPPNLEETFKKATEFMNQAFDGQPQGPEPELDQQQRQSHHEGGGTHAGPSGHAMPDASSIHEHLSGILNGKIGKLAKEIAEETAADLNLDMENETSMKGVFQQLLKNPSKLSGIIKTVGSKLDSKLKSGELKESEIMQEASELMSKMKSMPGMNNLASMLSKMGMNIPGGGGTGAKVNFGAMQSQLNRNMKQAQLRERLLKKVQDKQAATAAAAATTIKTPVANGATTAVFQSGEKPQRTPRHVDTPSAAVPAPAPAPVPVPVPVPAPHPASSKEKND